MPAKTAGHGGNRNCGRPKAVNPSGKEGKAMMQKIWKFLVGFLSVEPVFSVHSRRVI